jgi:hypothetical protein
MAWMSRIKTVLMICAALLLCAPMSRAIAGPEVPMAETPLEQLVVLTADGADQALVEVRALAPVTQMLPPRLLLVRAEPDARTTIRGLPGVIGLFDRAADVSVELSPQERIFVEAWAARAAPKTRAGDGLDWDAPGFEAPDTG